MLQNGQTVADADAVGARALRVALVAEVVEMSLGIDTETPAQETIARLHLRVLALLSNESSLAKVANDAHSVWQPSYAQAVANL
jgi:hypothetical protein